MPRRLLNRRMMPSLGRPPGVRRVLAPVAAAAGDIALFALAHPGGGPAPLVLAGYVLAAAAAAALGAAAGPRMPLAGLVVALALAALTGRGHIVMLWTSYRAGRAVVSRAGFAGAAGAAVGTATAFIMFAPAARGSESPLVAGYLIFVALPLLVGRYLAQQERLMSALAERNRELVRRRELLAEQERLAERLRIARDVHDSLGHRLSLASVQAAALEVSALPPEHSRAVRRLAGTVREAMDELQELVGTLRAEDDRGAVPGAGEIGALVAGFRTAGVPVELRESGPRFPLPPAAGHAAYRVVEEGLTNAVKHAPGRPVVVRAEWDPDALLVTVTNPLPPAGPAGDAIGDPAGRADGARLGTGGAAGDPVGRRTGEAAGYGLAGLGERVRAAGGLLRHGPDGDDFRLSAMLPAMLPAGAPSPAEDPPVATLAGNTRVALAGVAAALLMFGLLPAGMLMGLR
ncbi:hypothetical protein Sru01_28880 [Sphaerisporangium rufum]|uniref:histidine kinase n=1 Tax=Sphaerisporangium rufum TaxID=1381558 RepID=A0A919UYC5_9ACTN|nr:histidine kinase [Sphaerisporangium rufum]GII77906.1 hypothetical protein Sru01_28880 [Sphaerisporangium rufum]